MSDPRTVLAQNASPMTLDGTRTFIVGREQAAVIDPGPDLPAHLAALAEALADARSVAILLTHGHPDHAAGAPALAGLLAASGRLGYGPAIPADGETVPVDDGRLVALATPGHTPDHCAIHWPEEAAIFCGDLMMGGIDTALVAAPEGNLTHYLASLHRLEQLAPVVIYPTHGPHFTEPSAAFARYRAHRAERLTQVRAALAAGRRTVAEIAGYLHGGNVGPDLELWVRATTLAYLEHLAELGLAGPGDWHDDG